MDIDAAFNDFCQQHGIADATDRDKVFFLAGIKSTWSQQPRCYGHFAPDGSVLQLTEFIEPGRLSKPVPLYAKPVAQIEKPDVHVSVLHHVWGAYFRADADLIGFARWVERISKSGL